MRQSILHILTIGAVVLLAPLAMATPAFNPHTGQQCRTRNDCPGSQVCASK